MERFLNFLKYLLPPRLVHSLQPLYHFLLALAAALWYRFPSRGLLVIGVTGTKGKSTVVELLHAIAEAGRMRVASLSSLRFRIRDEVIPNNRKMTMPGRFFIQRFLSQARRAGCHVVILEVTSEGIRQFRHRFIRFRVAAMTNVAPEHLESHGSFERYLRAKLDLFFRLPRDGVAVINAQDLTQARFAAATAAKRVFYDRQSIQIGDRTFLIRELEVDREGIRFEYNGNPISSALRGDFNLWNLLAATAVASSLHWDPRAIREGIAAVRQVPGRFEFIQEEPFRVVVDYAHTPDSLRKVYESLRRENSKFETRNSKLICVLGSAGGGRDRWKRPEMGRIAAEFCKYIILTSEDPYDEDPQIILDEIERGVPTTYNPRPTTFQKILDRREAIREALRRAEPGDTVIITGKGAEPWIMGPAGSRIPWDDRQVTREELARLRHTP